ncbi:MAG: FAD-dependent oxidoreductase [Clostridia bacterium]|nr:FAD-dependent oxidoreductase [Clostridia bacterium]
MSTVKLCEQVNVRYEADVVVVGGGVAGAAAAIAAARGGKRTLLIEKSGCLGGLATNGHVSPFDATKDNSGNTFGGIGKEIIDRMVIYQDKYGCPKSASKRVGPHLFKAVLLDLATEAGVDILFHADVIKTVAEDDEVKNLIIHTKSGIEAVSAKMFIDATGDGDIFAEAGEEFVMGCEPESGTDLKNAGFDHMHFEINSSSKYDTEEAKKILAVQPCSVMFSMGNVDMTQNPIKYNNKNLKFEDLGIDRDEFFSLEYAGTVGFEENGDLIPLPQGRILFFPSGRPNELIVNMSRVIGVDGTDAVELSKAAVIAHKQVIYLADFLKRYVPGFEESYLVESSNVLGVRETRRLVGMHVLKGLDAINCVHYDDEIACGSYIIDIHDPFGKSRALGGAIHGDSYGIPYGCIAPKRVKNLLVCGRCISVDHIAHSSTRIQGTCVMTGQAAGAAAAVALDTGTTVQTVDVQKVREALKNDGVLLRQ